MAAPTLELIEALRKTALGLREGAPYRWTHMGACNCGHLAQTLTDLSPGEIRARALERVGEWAEQALAFCPASGLVIDHVLGTMLEIGLTREDIADLEKLSGPGVLRRIPLERRPLDYRSRDDVVVYMTAWADWLEEQRAGRAGDVPVPLRAGRQAWGPSASRGDPPLRHVG